MRSFGGKSTEAKILAISLLVNLAQTVTNRRLHSFEKDNLCPITSTSTFGSNFDVKYVMKTSFKHVLLISVVTMSKI